MLTGPLLSRRESGATLLGAPQVFPAPSLLSDSSIVLECEGLGSLTLKVRKEEAEGAATASMEAETTKG